MLKKLTILLLIMVPFCGMAQEKIDLLILNKDYSGALSLIDNQLAKQPDATLLFKKSAILRKQMQYPEALKQLDEALKLDSLNTGYLVERADLCELLGNYDGAVKNYQDAIALQQDNLLTKYSLGQMYLRIPDYANAAKTFHEICAVDSTNVMYNKYYALAVFRSDMLSEAITLYKKYLAQNPYDMTAYLNLATAYAGTDKSEDGVNTLFLAKEKFPNNKILDLKLAETIFRTRKYEEAFRLYGEYMAKYDTTLQVYANYGICLYYLKREQEAINVLESCFYTKPNDPYINFYLGTCHQKLGNYNLAAKYIEFAIIISMPEFLPEMSHRLGEVYSDMQEYDKAIEALKKSYDLDPGDVETLFEIATIYENFNSNPTMAYNYYRTYLMEAGDKAQNVGYALNRMNKIKEGMAPEK